MTSRNENETPIEQGQSIFDHLSELKKRVFYSLIFILMAGCIAYFFVTDIFDFLMAPLASTMGAESTNRLIYTHLAEGFFTSLKLAFFTGFYIALPFILIQAWQFIAPGLYRNEKKVVLPFMIATPVLFYLGGALVYWFIMPLAWDFFLSFQTTGFETSMPIQLEARISDYLNLIITFVFAFGLCFELPVLIGLLGHAGIVTQQDLRSKRRYVIVGAFILGAFLTPPDIISQITLAVSILILYEISILFVGNAHAKETKSTVSKQN